MLERNFWLAITCQQETLYRQTSVKLFMMLTLIFEVKNKNYTVLAIAPWAVRPRSVVFGMRS